MFNYEKSPQLIPLSALIFTLISESIGRLVRVMTFDIVTVQPLFVTMVETVPSHEDREPKLPSAFRNSIS